MTTEKNWASFLNTKSTYEFSSKKLNTIHNINKTIKHLAFNLTKNREDLQRTLQTILLSPKYFNG